MAGILRASRGERVEAMRLSGRHRTRETACPRAGWPFRARDYTARARVIRGFLESRERAGDPWREREAAAAALSRARFRTTRPARAARSPGRGRTCRAAHRS